MRVLITGVKGQLGVELRRALAGGGEPLAEGAIRSEVTINLVLGIVIIVLVRLGGAA